MARGLRSWLGGCLLVSALGMVPPPENVRMKSVNFKNVLQWEVPAFPKGNLTFTAQYQSYKKFQDMCTSTVLMECDFSSLSKYGDHTLRVRAEFADEHSDWVNITFCPVDDTMIGPPGMQVEALANSLHMRFLAPKIENEPETWTMRNIYNSWAYNVQYWKNGSDEKWPITCQYDFEVLRDLEPRTTYCVQVQGFLPDRNKTGEWSEPVCEPTTNAETAPSWTVAVVLAASVCVAFLLLGCSALLWCLYKKTKHAFSPGNRLPQHLKETGQTGKDNWDHLPQGTSKPDLLERAPAPRLEDLPQLPAEAAPGMAEKCGQGSWRRGPAGSGTKEAPENYKDWDRCIMGCSSLMRDVKFLGCPHHNTLLFSFPPSDDNEVFDKLSVITPASESSTQNPGNGCTPGTLSGQGSSRLVPEGEVHPAEYSTPLVLSPASEGKWSGKPPGQTPNLDLEDSEATSEQ